MPQLNNRHYAGKDIEMLTASSVILEAATDYKKELIAKRATWADPFFPNIEELIDTTIKKYIGFDSAKDLRNATHTLLSIQSAAIRDLEEVRTQIWEDFKTDKTQRTEILRQLGYTDYFKPAYRKDAEALVQLLFQFKQNIPNLQATIIAKGTSSQTLLTIVSYADTINNANITQENYKATRKTMTEEAVSAFNSVYDTIISVAKISAKFFKDDPAKKDRFIYSKVVKTLNTYTSPSTPTTPPSTPH